MLINYRVNKDTTTRATNFSFSSLMKHIDYIFRLIQAKQEKNARIRASEEKEQQSLSSSMPRISSDFFLQFFPCSMKII